MSDFKFTCPHCQQSLQVQGDMLGSVTDCPSCSNPIQLPTPNVQEEAHIAPDHPVQVMKGWIMMLSIVVVICFWFAAIGQSRLVFLSAFCGNILVALSIVGLYAMIGRPIRGVLYALLQLLTLPFASALPYRIVTHETSPVVVCQKCNKLICPSLNDDGRWRCPRCNAVFKVFNVPKERRLTLRRRKTEKAEP